MVAPSESPLLRWVLGLLDHYFAGPNLIWVVFLEAVMIAYTYGVATFVEDLVEMTRLPVLRRAAPVFYVFYYVLTPGALGVVSPHTLHSGFLPNRSVMAHLKPFLKNHKYHI